MKRRAYDLSLLAADFGTLVAVRTVNRMDRAKNIGVLGKSFLTSASVAFPILKSVSLPYNKDLQIEFPRLQFGIGVLLM